MAANVARRLDFEPSPDSRAMFLDRAWARSVALCARRQASMPTGAPFWHFLAQPAEVRYTEHGELSLEFGSPPLVVRASDAELVPTILDDLRRLKAQRGTERTDAQRVLTAQAHYAGQLLVDALELLAGGLAAFNDRAAHRAPPKYLAPCVPNL